MSAVSVLTTTPPLSLSHSGEILPLLLLAPSPAVDDSDDLFIGSGFDKMQGRREHMEDETVSLIAALETDRQQIVYATSHPARARSLNALFAVFDGHGGAEVSALLKATFVPTFLRELVGSDPKPTGDDGIDSVGVLCLERIMTTPEDVTAAMTRTMETLDRTIIATLGRKKTHRQGSTAVVSVIVGNQVVTANVGDSRSVIGHFSSHDFPSLASTSTSRSSSRATTSSTASSSTTTIHILQKVVDLSDDHKPDRPDETMRVRICGGSVSRSLHPLTFGMGSFRVYTRDGRGGLAMSRALGDTRLKARLTAQDKLRRVVELEDSSTASTSSRFALQALRILNKHNIVSSIPEITCHPLFPSDISASSVTCTLSTCIVVASDGLWDVMTSSQSLDFVLQYCQDHSVPPSPIHSRPIAEALVQRAYDLGSSDNISAVVSFIM